MKTTESSQKSCCAPDCCLPEATASAPVSPSSESIRDTVKARYGEAAATVLRGAGQPSCCSPASTSLLAGADPITRDLYDAEQAADVPEDALRASLGCGNPTALAELRAGEVVLDLGSGGGIDVLLSAKRVGPTGKAYGLDMTDEMLELALKNKAAAGATNVEFLKGHIEAIPLPRGTVDVVISNCVVNLSTDKPQVLREAHRVLRSGGRLAISDVVLRRELPDVIRNAAEAWIGCVGGALLESEYIAHLEAAGFVDISIEPTRVYTSDDASEFASGCCGADVSGTFIGELDGAIMSAFIRARKP